MSQPRPITKAQREAVNQHLAEPHRLSQVEVIRRLRLKSTNNFYRLVYRVIRSNQ